MPEDTNRLPDKMISFAPGPVFSGAWDHRPVVSSPLSSSPVRASSPLSPIDRNAVPQRQSQSSPIQPPKFKYAARPARPNPVMRRREDNQVKRRKDFLQSVRDKAEDKAWKRRDIEGQFLRATHRDGMEQLSYGAPEVSDADIEDAMMFQRSQIPNEDGDDMMMDEPPDEDDDVEAMAASYEQQAPPPARPFGSSIISDEDYDEIFAELIAQEQQNAPSAGQMDTEEENTMSF